MINHSPPRTSVGPGTDEKHQAIGVMEPARTPDSSTAPATFLSSTMTMPRMETEDERREAEHWDGGTRRGPSGTGQHRRLHGDGDQERGRCCCSGVGSLQGEHEVRQADQRHPALAGASREGGPFVGSLTHSASTGRGIVPRSESNDVIDGRGDR